MTSLPNGDGDRRRPVPDAVDLRLLAELAKTPSAGLPQLAWQAGLGQQDAAARLVTMNDAGLPLRLVAEGDPAALWQIVQRGPVPAATPNMPPPAWQQTAARPGPVVSPAGPASPDAAMTPMSPESMWGVPGTAAWASREADPASTTQQGWSTEVTATTLAERAAGPAQVPPMTHTPPVGTAQRAVGLSGERLVVTVTEVVDPGDDILSAAGFRLDDTERAVLVRTTVANDGPAPHDCMPDLYLFLVAADGRALPKAPVAIGGHPAHRVGVAGGDSADGWTIFLIDSDVAVVGVRWCVRPDLADRTLTWSLPTA
ncbi:hypothetical protein [Nakamurella lactea]|uniref:hypothetical protein n=1 Tax=Nakamurella lactea TaxID=459515 RepID=UPI00041DFD29|nr:hypothetical protein [Nakamurella lactea]